MMTEMEAAQGLLLMSTGATVPIMDMTTKGKPRERARPTDMSSYPVPPLCRGDGEYGWDQQLLTLPTIQLNAVVARLLRARAASPEDIAHLKRVRRRLKNREYTRKTRSRSKFNHSQ